MYGNIGMQIFEKLGAIVLSIITFCIIFCIKRLCRNDNNRSINKCNIPCFVFKGQTSFFQVMQQYATYKLTKPSSLVPCNCRNFLC